MKKNKVWLYIILTIMGAILVYLGGFVLVSEEIKQISGLCIGVGSAMFCLGIGNVAGAFLVSEIETEDMKRRIVIEVNDERNIRLKEKVGAKINQVVVYLLSIIVLALGFMGANIVIIFMVVGVMFIQLILAIVLFNYYGKRM